MREQDEDAPIEAPKAHVDDEASRETKDAHRLTDIRRPAALKRLITPSGPVVGVDLGTVNSCVAISEHGQPWIIPVGPHRMTLPSVVYVSGEGRVLVGHKARERMVLHPKRAVYASKRFLGRPFTSKEVASLGHFFSYEMVRGPEGRVAAKLGATVMPLEQVAGHILRALREVASDTLKTNVQRAVVTVPAYFGEMQRQAVREAGRIAGLHVERVLNEPTAAAVAYGLGHGYAQPAQRNQGTVLVYDLGGGTFDASVLKIDGDRMEVLASDGDAFLGGSDFDDRLTEWLLQVFEKETKVSLRREPVALQRLKMAAEVTKRQLSEASSAFINLPFITQRDDEPVDLNLEVTRATFDDLTGDLIERTLGITQKVLDAAHVQGDALDDVILVGGQSRMPAVSRALTERFGRRPSKVVHPDEAVALGAALVAEMLDSHAPVALTDVLAADIRLAKADGDTLVLLAQGVSLPTEKAFRVALHPSQKTQTFIRFCRGAESRATDNTTLGFIKLPGVDGGPQTATVTLSVSCDGLMAVKADHPTAGTIELDVLL